MEKNRVKKISHSRKRQNKLYPIRASKCLKTSQIGIQKILLWPFEVFRPIGRNANRKFEGAPDFLGDEIQNSTLNVLCALSPSTSVQNFRSIRQACGPGDLFFEIGHCAARTQAEKRYAWNAVKRLQRSRLALTPIQAVEGRVV